MRQTASLLNLNGFSGGNLLTAPAAPGTPTAGQASYPWFLNVSDDALTNAWDEDEAWFGEVTFGLTEKLDLTFGARISDKTGGDIRYVPIDAFRTPDPGRTAAGRPVRVQPDRLAHHGAPQDFVDPDKPTIDTYKFSAAYQWTPDVMVYLTYAEGFTSARSPLITIGPTSVIESIPASMNPERVERDTGAHRSCRRSSSTTPRSGCAPTGSTASCASTPRTSIRIGTACASRCCRRTRPATRNRSRTTRARARARRAASSSRSSGRRRIDCNLNFGLGPHRHGVHPGRCADGPAGPSEHHGQLPRRAVRLRAGAELLDRRSVRDPDVERRALLARRQLRLDGTTTRATPRISARSSTQNGNPVLEPAYGILNARFVYEPAARNYSVELWGKNLHGRAVRQRRLRYSRHVGLRLLDRRPRA